MIVYFQIDIIGLFFLDELLTLSIFCFFSIHIERKREKMNRQEIQEITKNSAKMNRIYICVHTHARARAHTHTHARTHARTHTRIYTYIHIHILIYRGRGEGERRRGREEERERGREI